MVSRYYISKLLYGHFTRWQHTIVKNTNIFLDPTSDYYNENVIGVRLVVV